MFLLFVKLVYLIVHILEKKTSIAYKSKNRERYIFDIS